MSNDKFLKLCKEIVVKYFNEHADKTDKKQITEDDVFIVWSCKTLQNNKALVSTTVSDGMYYEITHNGDKHETYVDAYKEALDGNIVYDMNIGHVKPMFTIINGSLINVTYCDNNVILKQNILK